MLTYEIFDNFILVKKETGSQHPTGIRGSYRSRCVPRFQKLGYAKLATKFANFDFLFAALFW